MVLRLFFLANLPDGAGGAELGAAGAFRPAETLLEGHAGLHQVLQVRGGLEHVVGALRHAELAARAAAVEVFHALGAGRGDGRLALRRPLGQHLGKAAVHLLGRLLRPGLDAPQRRGAQHGHRSGHHGAASGGGRGGFCPRFDCFWCFGGGRGGFCPRTPCKAVLQRTELALVYAVEAVHAAGMVNVLRILAYGDALGLAVELAGLAVLALVVVYQGTEHGEAGEETEGGAHRADAVAVGSAALEGQGHHYRQRYHGHHEGGYAAHPHLLLIEGIAAGAFREVGQQVVSPQIHGLQQVLDHAAVGAVRGQEGHQGLYAGHQGHHKEGPHAVAQPFVFFLVVIRLLAPAGSQPGNPVLEHAQRANHRAVHAAADQRQ